MKFIRLSMLCILLLIFLSVLFSTTYLFAQNTRDWTEGLASSYYELAFQEIPILPVHTYNELEEIPPDMPYFIVYENSRSSSVNNVYAIKFVYQDYSVLLELIQFDLSTRRIISSSGSFDTVYMNNMEIYSIEHYNENSERTSTINYGSRGHMLSSILYEDNSISSVHYYQNDHLVLELHLDMRMEGNLKHYSLAEFLFYYYDENDILSRVVHWSDDEIQMIYHYDLLGQDDNMEILQNNEPVQHYYFDEEGVVSSINTTESSRIRQIERYLDQERDIIDLTMDENEDSVLNISRSYPESEDEESTEDENSEEAEEDESAEPADSGNQFQLDSIQSLMSGINFLGGSNNEEEDDDESPEEDAEPAQSGEYLMQYDFFYEGTREVSIFFDQDYFNEETGREEIRLTNIEENPSFRRPEEAISITKIDTITGCYNFIIPDNYSNEISPAMEIDLITGVYSQRINPSEYSNEENSQFVAAERNN